MFYCPRMVIPLLTRKHRFVSPILRRILAINILARVVLRGGK